MNQNIFQILCMCQHKFGQRWRVMKFQRMYAKHFNKKNQVKSIFATICSTYCIIQCKIKMICLIYSQKLITVHVIINQLYLALVFIKMYSRQQHMHYHYIYKIIDSLDINWIKFYLSKAKMNIFQLYNVKLDFVKTNDHIIYILIFCERFLSILYCSFFKMN